MQKVSEKCKGILFVLPVETTGAKKPMKMVCAMAMVCRRVRFVERPEAIQMTMGTSFVRIAGTCGATMETQALCLVVGLIVQSAGQWQMKHNKKGVRCNWTPFCVQDQICLVPLEHVHAGNVVQNAVIDEGEIVGLINYRTWIDFKPEQYRNGLNG